jgi:hypothetical protein
MPQKKYNTGKSYMHTQSSKFPLIITTGGIVAVSMFSLFLAWLLFSTSENLKSAIEIQEKMRTLYFENPNAFSQEDLNRILDKGNWTLGAATKTFSQFTKLLAFIGVLLAGIATVQVTLLLNAKSDHSADA